ncbi:MAG TPA: MBL fold metallo-hydrolase [Bryobacteraceae bacterium]|nr:MBL fold metallo-hydrolase [Bryobacteraceae bacterium]
MRTPLPRRWFRQWFLCLAAVTAALAQQPPAPGRPPNLVKIQDDLFIVQNQANTLADLIAYGGNATAYVTDAGVILIDSKSDREHDDLVAKLKSVTDEPVKYVILTHNHADHTGGAAKLAAMGATVVISNADRANMVRAGDKYIPDFGYIGQAEVTLGGKRAELRQFRGHTRGDTVVYLPAARTILLGDLLTTADTIPMIVNYGDGGSWTDWTISIDEILKMDFDNVIPGHGPMIGKRRLIEIREKFGALMARVRTMNREKKTEQEMQQALIKEFNWGAGPSAGNIAGMMIELR